MFPGAIASFSRVAWAVLSAISCRKGLGPSGIRKNKIMKKFLLGLVAVAAVLLPMSQNAQAYWVHYSHYYGHPYYGHPYAYAHHRYWHRGYWYGGYWHTGFWGFYPAPVIVVAP